MGLSRKPGEKPDGKVVRTNPICVRGVVAVTTSNNFPDVTASLTQRSVDGVDYVVNVEAFSQRASWEPEVVLAVDGKVIGFDRDTFPRWVDSLKQLADRVRSGY